MSKTLSCTLAVLVGTTFLLGAHLWLGKAVHNAAKARAAIEAEAMWACGRVGGAKATVMRSQVKILCNDGSTIMVRLGPSLN